MFDGTDVVYYYDGSYEGFLSCVFESFDRKELPIAIEAGEADQATLFETRMIETDREKSERVRRSIPVKISLEAKELIEEAFLTDMPDKELRILYFMRLGYKYGGKVTEWTTNDEVDAMRKAVLRLSREANQYIQFIRFSDVGGALFAQIRPKNNVLPLIAQHFCTRFAGENFMIFDRSHKMALMYKDGQRSFINADDIELPPVSPEEAQYRALWKKFYDTVAVEGRINPSCRRNHMPKRYWNEMTEFDADPEMSPSQLAFRAG